MMENTYSRYDFWEVLKYLTVIVIGFDTSCYACVLYCDNEILRINNSSNQKFFDFLYWDANGYHLFSQILIVNANFTAHRIEG